jgi:hypothetical protein
MNVGLTLKSIRLRNRLLNRRAVALFVYVADDLSIASGRPLTVSRVPLGPFQPGTALAYEGLGLLLVPPREVGSAIIWRVELWQGEEARHQVERWLSDLVCSITLSDPLVRSLAAAPPDLPGAELALGNIAGRMGHALSGAGDERLEVWPGSLRCSQVEDLTGSVFRQVSYHAEIELGILATEGEGPQAADAE